jgi:hypothetical protein
MCQAEMGAESIDIVLLQGQMGAKSIGNGVV